MPNIGSPDWSAGITILADQPGQIINSSSITTGGGRRPSLEFRLLQDNPPIDRYAASSIAWANTDLGEMVEWGYRLRRIVGKLFIGVDTPIQDFGAGLSALLVTAGFMVRRVDAQTGLPEATGSESNPSSLGNVRDPWIWRRSWILRNSSFPDPGPIDVAGTTVPTNTVIGPNPDARILAQYPSSTAGYHSVADGPHIDAKTARIIGPEERLILNISFTTMPRDDVNPTDWDVVTVLDYRVLGSLRSSQGNRRNASR